MNIAGHKTLRFHSCSKYSTVTVLTSIFEFSTHVLMYLCVVNCETLLDAQAHQSAAETAWTAFDPAHPDWARTVAVADSAQTLDSVRRSRQAGQ